MKFLAAVGLLALSIAAAGCGNDSETDLVNGKTKFVEKCGSCHQLARAGTAGVVGPNLDDAFRQARRDGMGDTIEGVTLQQIKLPSQKLSRPNMIMPPNIVTGQDAKDVAAYVSYAAALPGKDTGDLAAAGGGTDGKSLFTTNCGSCHTLASAGTSGTTGPNLNNLSLDQKAVIAQIGAGGNGMPAFKGTLTDEQIQMISEYLTK